MFTDIDHPFTAPAAIPLIKVFEHKLNITIIGRTERDNAHMIAP